MAESLFHIHTSYIPTGDQPAAIEQLVSSLNEGVKNQVLLGVTGSGKTFTMANVIAKVGRPALVLAPNKTLAAQLYNEFRVLFPENAVEYFVSYYDYYQPEAYVPASDTYIEKDSAINDDIDKLRHAATHALLTRRDVIIVASVSCIYGLGSPEYYARLVIPVERGQRMDMRALTSRLVDVQYTRNDMDFHRGTFRVRGDVLEIIPAYEHERALRLDFFGDEIDAVREIDPLTGKVLGDIGKTVIYPASHYVSDRDNLQRAMSDIRDELNERLRLFQSEGKLVEAQRLEQRTQLDLEMMEELGYCNGIENYSRHLDGRKVGEPPSCLLDYFPQDFILFADESHISIPQTGGMSRGDRARKQTLVDYGFRLPSALDNRPLTFEEFKSRLGQCIFVSATPGPWEIEQAQGLVAEQIIRPTGLLDPEVSVLPSKGQVERILSECKCRAERDERVLITTLTKRMAEELTDYLNNMGVAARYLHSDIDTLERLAIIRALRGGEFDVLVGINLLREGLDIPEVSLVAILDADKEGFLRSSGALIQTFGRAARNAAGAVLLFADSITAAMRTAMDETARRRSIQQAWNTEKGIIPHTISKPLDSILDTLCDSKKQRKESGRGKFRPSIDFGDITRDNIQSVIRRLEQEMRSAAAELAFEKAAELRDRIRSLKNSLLAVEEDF